jgi:hypothetical protein
MLFEIQQMMAWVTLVLLLAVGTAYAADPVDLAFNRLAKVGYFAFGGTSAAGVIAQGEKDFRLVLSNSTAITYFEKLYTVANFQARCYALVGLHQLDLNRFKQLINSVAEPEAEVITINGCNISHESFAEVIKRISAGKYPGPAR